MERDLSRDLRAAGSIRVSIGLPVFNGGRFIRRAIESHLEQTFGDFELIVSDNGSTDETPRHLRRVLTHGRTSAIST